MNKRGLRLLLTSLILTSSLNIPVYGAEIQENQVGEQETIKESKSNTDTNNEIITCEPVEVQVETLISKVADEIGVDEHFVKLVYLLYENKAEYFNTTPNIEADETIKEIGLANEIGVEYLKAPWTLSLNEEVEHNQNKYLPDALYTDSYKIEELRKGIYNEYIDKYDNISDNILTSCSMYSAVISYLNNSEYDFMPVYLRLIAIKDPEETMVVKNETGEIKVKDYVNTILEENGLTEPIVKHCISCLMAYDVEMYNTGGIDSAVTSVKEPYEINQASHENIVLAASSIIGKCRYVWGGGHGGAGNIDGISPIWKEFNDQYKDTDLEGCIRPAGSNCPVHGSSSSTCNRTEVVYDASQYADSREFIDNGNEIEGSFSSLNTGEGVDAHRLEGLDCSGFVSWVYNQNTDAKSFNAQAKNFIKSMGLEELPMGSKLEPGDVFAWYHHIVLIIAPFSETGQVYLTAESAPDIVRYGVVYYTGASQEEINNTMELALELNQLIGGLDETEGRPNKYNMNSKGLYVIESEGLVDDTYGQMDGDLTETSQAEENVETDRPKVEYGHYSGLGRYHWDFGEDYDDSFKELYAVEMMQRVVDELPYELLSGYKIYENRHDRFIKSNNTKLIE